MKNIEDLLVFYKGSDANGELFNKNINDKRYKRANKLEKFSYAADIVHATIAGVCIVVGTAATAASFFVAPGSTPAVAWAVAGGISALAGGSNTIWKTSTDYAENAVYVTQCVNTGYVRSADNSSDKVGGIVGVMHDYGIISDCLNSGHGNTEGGGHFVGSMKVRSELLNSLTIANINGWNDLIGDTPAESYKTDNIYYCSDESNQTSVPNVYMRPSYNIPAYRSKGLTTAQISQKSSYDLDLDSLWTLSAQPGAFPIPYKSEYQLK